MRPIRHALPTLLLILATAAPSFANFDGYFPGVGSRADWEKACSVSEAGLAAKKQGHLLQAERLYKQSIKIYPHDAAVYVNLGNTLLDADKLEEAASAYKHSIEVEPHFANWLGLTKVLIEQEQIDAAKQAIGKASNYAKTESDRKTISKYISGLKQLQKNASR